VKNQNVTGNAKNHNVLNQNASWSVKIPIVFQKLIAAHAIWELLLLLILSHSLKKLKLINNAVNVKNRERIENNEYVNK
jgi:hypothetical protein